MHAFSTQRSISRSRSPRPKATVVSLTALVVAVLLTFPAFAEIERSFDTGSGGELRVEADGSSVNVRAGSGSEVRVHIERHRGSEPIENDYGVLMEQDGSDVFVQIERKKKLDWGRNSGLKVTVDVPKQYNLNIRTSGGSLAVNDLDGDIIGRTSGGSISLGRVDGTVDAKTSGGSITLASSTVTANLSTSGGSITAGDISGDLSARTSGGSVKIDRADGDVEVSTSGGSITLGEIAGAIDASTSGGSVRAAFTAQPTSDSRLSTSGGTVRVTLAPGLGFDLDAKGSSGISTDVPITISGRVKDREITGTINGGGPALVLRASGGRVVLSEE